MTKVEIKKPIVDEIKGYLEKTAGIILIDYRSLTVEQDIDFAAARIQEMLERMPGDIPVYLNIPKENITLLAPRSMWVDDAWDARATLMSELNDQDMKVVEK